MKIRGEGGDKRIYTILSTINTERERERERKIFISDVKCQRITIQRK